MIGFNTFNEIAKFTNLNLKIKKNTRFYYYNLFIISNYILFIIIHSTIRPFIPWFSIFHLSTLHSILLLLLQLFINYLLLNYIRLNYINFDYITFNIYFSLYSSLILITFSSMNLLHYSTFLLSTILHYLTLFYSILTLNSLFYSPSKNILSHSRADWGDGNPVLS